MTIRSGPTRIGSLRLDSFLRGNRHSGKIASARRDGRLELNSSTTRLSRRHPPPGDSPRGRAVDVPAPFCHTSPPLAQARPPAGMSRRRDRRAAATHGSAKRHPGSAGGWPATRGHYARHPVPGSHPEPGDYPEPELSVMARGGMPLIPSYRMPVTSARTAEKAPSEPGMLTMMQFRVPQIMQSSRQGGK